MKTIESLKQKSKSIDNEIRKRYPYDADKDFGPICDGIIDFCKYFNAKYRILWILKEPYDKIDKNDNAHGGCWYLRDGINSKKSINDFNLEMYFRMMYVSWGILNNFCAWKEIPHSNKIIRALKSTGIINIKKIPGIKKSRPSVIMQAYREDKDILLNQIEVYAPDILIFGNTFSYFKDDLMTDLESVNLGEGGYLSRYYHGKQLFLPTYHPSLPELKKEENEEVYCNEIIEAVKKWKNRK